MASKKQFSLEYFCEPLMENPSYFSKRMFGGLAIYCNDLMVFVITESPGENEWKGQAFDFDLWNGVLVCTSREHHQQLRHKFGELVSHPILGKWLYIPMTALSFEATVEGLVEMVQLRDHRIGIVPGQSKKRSKVKKQKKVTDKKAKKKVVERKVAKKKAKKKVAKKQVAQKTVKKKVAKKKLTKQHAPKKTKRAKSRGSKVTSAQSRKKTKKKLSSSTSSPAKKSGSKK